MLVPNRLHALSAVHRPLILLLAGTLLTACNTEHWGKPKVDRDNGPTTSLENPEGIALPDIQVTDRTEVDLVEQTVFHRAMYARHLKILAQYYSENGYEDKANWARNELRDLARVKDYKYILDAETPVATLRPVQNVAAADRLYEEGLALMKQGGHNVIIFYNQETMKLALAKFKELIEKYPNSDKIDDAAFMIGELHKEYFEEKDNVIALEWYRKALEWNPNTPHPVRFQMAAVYDYRLHDRDRALSLYQEVLEKETFNKSNVEWSNARIGQLTLEKTRHAPGEPLPKDRPALTGSPDPAAGGGEAAAAGPAPSELRE
jgi:tetratricopeptide (TPR) repeat protein